MKNLILTLVFAITSLVSFSQESITSASAIDTILITDFYTTVSDANNAYNNNIVYILDTDTVIKLTYNNNNGSTSITECKLFPGRPNNSAVTPYSLNAMNTDTTFFINVNDFYIFNPAPTHDTIFTRVKINGLGDGSGTITWFKIVKVTQEQWNDIQLGVNDLELTTTRLSAYPNPATSNITIDFDVTTNEVPVAIFSMSGQLVYSNDDNRNNGTNSLNVDVSSFQTGIYIVKAGSQTFKFVKQ